MLSIRAALIVPCLFIGMSYIGDELVSQWATEDINAELLTSRRQLRGGGGGGGGNSEPAPPPPPSCDTDAETHYRGQYTGRVERLPGTDCSLIWEYHCERLVTANSGAGNTNGTNSNTTAVGACVSPDGSGGYDCWVCANSPETLSCVNKTDPCFDEDENGVWIAVFFNVFMPLLFSIPSCVATLYFRNKSMNKAPFNGQDPPPIPDFSKNQQVTAAAPVVAVAAPATQIMQVQCPAESGPGSSVTITANGQSLTVIVPEGVAPGSMFQVQVPAAPGATVMNPMADAGSPAVGGDVLDMCDGLAIQQVIDVVELYTGCERKNQYSIHQWSADTPNFDGPVVMYVKEDSDGCERACCKQQRHLVLYVFEGAAVGGRVLLQIHKCFAIPQCCCLRPQVMLYDGLGNFVGKVDDPFHCCTMDQTITDGEGTQIYGAAGSVCQPGMCCPCCGSVDFDITDASGQPTTGKIEKVFNGCAEMAANVNKFHVAFPVGATHQQKMVLLGTTMLIDFEYFERN